MTVWTNASNSQNSSWTNDSDEQTTWTGNSVSGSWTDVSSTITHIVPGNPIGLLLALTYASNITVIVGPGSASWDDQNELNTTWTET